MSYQTLHHRSVRLAAKERPPRQSQMPAPKCAYCGKRVPKARRGYSDYCTQKCINAEHKADEESREMEKDLTEIVEI